jgi:hypothetical protein
LIVQFVLNKFSHGPEIARPARDAIGRGELCCTTTGYAGCVPRSVITRRTYSPDRMSVGPKFAASRNQEFTGRSAPRVSLCADTERLADNTPFPRGT